MVKANVIGMQDDSCDLATRIQRWPGALKVPELAVILGFKLTAIYEMVAAGRIPYIRIGPSIRFDPAITAAWLRARTVSTLLERRAA